MARNHSWCYCLINFVLMIFLSTSLNAAEYYKTEITYTNIKLDAKGRKTDFETKRYLDDVVKKATLDFTDENKLKIAVTARNRIFNNTSQNGNYSNLAVTNITKLLTDNLYKIDYLEKSIYKTSNPHYSCQNFGYKWAHNSIEYNCPIDAANAAASSFNDANNSNCHVLDLYTNQHMQVKISEVQNFTGNSIYARIRCTYVPTGGDTHKGVFLHRRDKIEDGPREYITDLQLANLLINNRVAIPEIFTAANVYEITNNSAYLALEYLLKNSSNEESPDSSIKPDIDEEGNNTGGFNLPSFCDWAKPVCDFISWVKQEVSSPNDTEIELDRRLDMESPELKTYLNYEKQCPEPIRVQAKLFEQDFLYEFEFTFLCNFFNRLSTFLLAASYFVGAMIISGVRNA